MPSACPTSVMPELKTTRPTRVACSRRDDSAASCAMLAIGERIRFETKKYCHKTTPSSAGGPKRKSGYASFENLCRRVGGDGRAQVGEGKAGEEEVGEKEGSERQLESL